VVLNGDISTAEFVSNNFVALVHQQTIPTELYPLSAKLVPTFADRGCRVVSAAVPLRP
jgi:hypothetical protein